MALAEIGLRNHGPEKWNVQLKIDKIFAGRGIDSVCNCGSIFLLSNKLQTLGDAVLEKITLKQWLLLIMIFSMEEKQPSVTEIAEFIGGTRQNVRKMLEVLSAKGYVTLCINKQDKRNLSVALTDKAFLFFTQFETKGADFLERLFDGIDSGLQESTRTTVETLFNNLERMKMQYGKSDSHI